MGKIYLIISILFSLIVAIIIGIALGNSLPGFMWSGAWWLLNISVAFSTIILSNVFIDRILVSHEHLLPTPTAATAFDEAIKLAKYNFFAISSKSMALWRTDTFVHYLLLNDVKNVLEYSYKNRGMPIFFSDDPKDRNDFLNEGRDIISRIASDKGVPFFWGMRLLIYPKSTLHIYKDQVLALMQLHSLARVHCIPIIREELLKILTEEERAKLSKFAESLGQKRIDSEMTLYSPVLRIRTYIKQFFDPNHPFRYKIPDVLAVNIFSISEDRPEIWWFKGVFAEHDKGDKAEESEKIIYILCKAINRHFNNVVWNEYSLRNIPIVPVAKKISDVEIDFFSLPYFGKWLNAILSSSESSGFSRLKKWFVKEEEILKKLAKGGKAHSALDVGCGWGRHVKLLLDSGVKYVAGIDASPAMVARANALHKAYPRRVSIRLERAENMTFEDESFDIVVCMTNTFGNFGAKKKIKALKEMIRVLKPGGTLLLSVYKHTEEALELRVKSYESVGLHPSCVDGKTVYTTEGLVAEQFSEEEILQLLDKHGMDAKVIERIRNLAFIVTGKRRI